MMLNGKGRGREICVEDEIWCVFSTYQIEVKIPKGSFFKLNAYWLSTGFPLALQWR